VTPPSTASSGIEARSSPSIAQLDHLSLPCQSPTQSAHEGGGNGTGVADVVGVDAGVVGVAGRVGAGAVGAGGVGADGVGLLGAGDVGEAAGAGDVGEAAAAASAVLAIARVRTAAGRRTEEAYHSSTIRASRNFPGG